MNLTIATRPVAVTKPQAADLLSVSIDSLERYVLPDLRVIRRGRLVLIPMTELERWCEAHAERTLPEPSARHPSRRGQTT